MTVSQGRLVTQPIRYVKGVGPGRAATLATLGITTVEDACLYPPRRYEDRTRFVAIRQLTPGEPATIRGRILAKSLKRLRGGRTIFEAAIGDASGVCTSLWFNQPYLEGQLTVGEEVILHGRVEGGGKPQMMHPEMERVDLDDDASLHMGRIVPIYPVANGLSQRWFRRFLWTVLDSASESLEEPLPEPIREVHRWPGMIEAVRELHFPSSWESLEAARQRLVFDELFLLQVALAERRALTVMATKSQRYQRDGPLTQGLRERLPFTLTRSQQQVLQELLEDLARPHPMHRLLHGDVGCGKTIVVAWLMAVAVQSGCQVALMAPTELLAEQHARLIGALFAPLGVSVGLLSQGVEPRTRRAREAAIATGRLSVVIGTHALIQRGLAFKRLALIVIDEQHKFGVVQRSLLARKAARPDVLVVTATPIPRTLALTVYGDLAVSTITELPPGRQPIQTVWLHERQRDTLYAMIRQELRAGHQAYIVYPLVESVRRCSPRAEHDTRCEAGLDPEGTRRIEEHVQSELKAATQMACHLQSDVFPEFRVGLLHGQMRSTEKERTMRAFAGGRLHLLVSTVIVEVGLDVPNATLMVIEHPERFGIAQLHQMRGRIGRSTHQATCALISRLPPKASAPLDLGLTGSAGLDNLPEDPADGVARERLRVFVETTDGFRLAEKDLELRGPGDLLGRRQHGVMRLRLANLIRDRELLETARTEATRLVERDPHLASPALAVLRDRLARFKKVTVTFGQK